MIFNKSPKVGIRRKSVKHCASGHKKSRAGWPGFSCLTFICHLSKCCILVNFKTLYFQFLFYRVNT